MGDSDCEARGYEREDFREIDTGTEGMFTLALVASSAGEGTAPPETDSGETTLGDRTGGTVGTPEPEAEPEPETDTAGTGDTGVDIPDTLEVSETTVGLAFCNEDGVDRFISVGYEGAEGWTSEGWWIVGPGDCTSPELDGQRHRYVYYRAENGDGEFTGEGFSFCVTEDAFSIVGDANCEARGYETADFSELDIGDEGMFTVTLAASEAPAPESEPEPEVTPEPEPEAAPESDGSFGGDFGGTDTGASTGDTGDAGGDANNTGTDTGTTGGTGGFDFGDNTPDPDDSAPEADATPEPEGDDAPTNPRRSGSRGR